ncbi:MAG: DUF4437 domain-containing protein [Pseudomonadota bacterium]
MRLVFVLLSLALTSCGALNDRASTVIHRSELTSQPLNPARGDASPAASVMWGDLKKNVPTGALIEFVDGFSSPPHIHNVTYRGLVISGRVHNAHPDADTQWMEPGSFWVQAAGENHITAAEPGDAAVIFLEIVKGPYLVKPPAESFQGFDVSKNVPADEIPWLDADSTSWLLPANPTATDRLPTMTVLWGSAIKGERFGSLLRLPIGYRGELRSDGRAMHGVLIRGKLVHSDQSSAPQSLDVGSYFAWGEAVSPTIACETTPHCLLYISASKPYLLTAKP